MKVLSLVWAHVQGKIPDYPLVIFEANEIRKQRVGTVESVVNCLVQEALEKNRSNFVPVDRLIELDSDESVLVHPPSPPERNISVDEVEESFAELLADPPDPTAHILDMNPPANYLSSSDNSAILIPTTKRKFPTGAPRPHATSTVKCKSKNGTRETQVSRSDRLVVFKICQNCTVSNDFRNISCSCCGEIIFLEDEEENFTQGKKY